MQLLQPYQNRREIERWIHRRMALLVIPELKGVYSCGLRDLSVKGAGLRLDGVVLLPTKFRLLLDAAQQSTFACRLIWRDGDYVGITFWETDGRPLH